MKLGFAHPPRRINLAIAGACLGTALFLVQAAQAASIVVSMGCTQPIAPFHEYDGTVSIPCTITNNTFDNGGKIGLGLTIAQDPNNLPFFAEDPSSKDKKDTISNLHFDDPSHCLTAVPGPSIVSGAQVPSTCGLNLIFDTDAKPDPDPKEKDLDYGVWNITDGLIAHSEKLHSDSNLGFKVQVIVADAPEPTSARLAALGGLMLIAPRSIRWASRRWRSSSISGGAMARVIRRV